MSIKLFLSTTSSIYSLNIHGISAGHETENLTCKDITVIQGKSQNWCQFAQRERPTLRQKPRTRQLIKMSIKLFLSTTSSIYSLNIHWISAGRETENLTCEDITVIQGKSQNWCQFAHRERPTSKRNDPSFSNKSPCNSLICPPFRSSDDFHHCGVRMDTDRAQVDERVGNFQLDSIFSNRRENADSVLHSFKFLF